MIDTSLTIHSRLVTYRPLIDGMEVHISRRHQWQEICPEDREAMVGTAVECLTKAEVSDLFINTNSLDYAILCVGSCMKTRKGRGELRRSMRDCMMEAVESLVMEAYEYVQFDYLSDDMAQHGKYPYTSRETGELEWRRHA